MPVPENIVKLVETFHRNREDYTSGRYNETQVRRGKLKVGIIKATVIKIKHKVRISNILF